MMTTQRGAEARTHTDGDDANGARLSEGGRGGSAGGASLSGGAAWDVGGTTVVRYDDFVQARRAAAAAESARLEELAREYLRASEAYQRSLRALPVTDEAGAALTWQAMPPTVAAMASGQSGGVGAAGGTTHAANELTGHDYDGIQEYDNPTPGWWHLLFAGTIAFSALYTVVYHFSPALGTVHERLARNEARALQVQFAELNKVPPGEGKLLKIMAEEKWLAQGEAIFKGSCTLCHGQAGEGSVGPNLTDEVYKNATDLMSMHSVVVKGTPNGAMPAKGGAQLNANEIDLVVAYVASLRGKNLPGPRGEEGVPISPWPTLDAEGNVVAPAGAGGGAAGSAAAAASASSPAAS